jgi:predicted ATP-dependent endonuclease of OLD family
MWINKVELSNIRCFAQANINFSERMNVLIGENNSGKSTILHAIRHIQEGGMNSTFIRSGEQDGSVKIYFQGDATKYFGTSLIYVSYTLTNPNLLINTSPFIEKKSDLFRGTNKRASNNNSIR